MKLLTALHGAGATIIMVTHDQRFARMSGRTVHVFDGKIVDEAVAVGS